MTLAEQCRDEVRCGISRGFVRILWEGPDLLITDAGKWMTCEERTLVKAEWQAQGLAVSGNELMRITPGREWVEKALTNPAPDPEWNAWDAFALRLARCRKMPLTEPGRNLMVEALRTAEDAGIRKIQHISAEMLRQHDVSGMWESGRILLQNRRPRK